MKLHYQSRRCGATDISSVSELGSARDAFEAALEYVPSANVGKSSSPSNASVKRISVSLSADAAQLLEYLAQTQGITQNEALRKAIATEAYFLKEMKEGSKILLQKSDKEIREVIFR